MCHRNSLWSLVAVSGGLIVGIIIAELRTLSQCCAEDRAILDKSFPETTPVCYILSLGVRKEWQRRGIASKLLHHLFSYIDNPLISSHGRIRCVFLHVLVSNEAAIRFYEHWHFRCLNRLKNYYVIDGNLHDSFTYVNYLNGGYCNWSLKFAVLPNASMSTEPDIVRLASIFPRKSVSMIFAYGSGVIKQWQRSTENAMLDFVIAVDNPEDWHAENMKKNRRHYSFLRFFGARRVATFQTAIPAKLYCNTMVPVDGRLIKYSVIKTSDCISDLQDWESMYVSGRMHKPVRFIVSPQTSKLKQACNMNLESACYAALLLLPERFTEEELYEKISSLSYIGDPRMWLAEDRFKIRNIVKANVDSFSKLYSPVLKVATEHTGLVVQGSSFEQSLNAIHLHHLLALLPKNVLWKLERWMNRNLTSPRDMEEVIYALSRDLNSSELVEKAIRNIVFRASFCQTAKNAISAGFYKSLAYGFRKVAKMLSSYLRS
ncbi:Mitochondrial translocator assembly [Trichuris trichiura]|uniref:Phosphatidate cytidylyltransferase, mitochondrial n=1 Tax=Trichuris trichiura TaxID=36087 RepID=A0A077ZJX3_TRITR|nr:Mitochondrial translocator assembly [Trichuris trichiura]